MTNLNHAPDSTPEKTMKAIQRQHHDWIAQKDSFWRHLVIEAHAMGLDADRLACAFKKPSDAWFQDHDGKWFYNLCGSTLWGVVARYTTGSPIAPRVLPVPDDAPYFFKSGTGREFETWLELFGNWLNHGVGFAYHGPDMPEAHWQRQHLLANLAEYLLVAPELQWDTGDAFATEPHHEYPRPYRRAWDVEGDVHDAWDLAQLGLMQKILPTLTPTELQVIASRLI
jgi:hypothetical protein